MDGQVGRLLVTSIQIACGQRLDREDSKQVSVMGEQVQKNKETKTTRDYRVRTAPLLLVTVCLQMPGHHTGHTPKDERTETQSSGEKAVVSEGGQHQLS